jgi:DNA-binding LytR/AlgR family response regulator
VKPKYIVFKEGTKQVKLESKELLYIKKEANYIEIFTINNRYVIRHTIDKFIVELSDSDFVRTHRSYAVQLKNVEQIKNNDIIIGNEIIPISRQFKSRVKNIFKYLN